MIEAIMQIPREGELVTIPLLTSATATKPYLALTIATGAAVGATKAGTLSSQGITYAALRVLGFIIQGNFASTEPTGAILQLELADVKVDGGIPLIYGSVLQSFRNTFNYYAAGTATKSKHIYGDTSFFVPSTRDNPVLFRTQKIKANLKARSLVKPTKGSIACWAQMMAVCERVDDPGATQ